MWSWSSSRRFLCSGNVIWPWSNPKQQVLLISKLTACLLYTLWSVCKWIQHPAGRRSFGILSWQSPRLWANGNCAVVPCCTGIFHSGIFTSTDLDLLPVSTFLFLPPVLLRQDNSCVPCSDVFWFAWILCLRKMDQDLQTSPLLQTRANDL